MPLQNKVDPSGNITNGNMRGQLMGNRGGRIHDPLKKTLLPTRRWASRQWICCETSFKQRQRSVMGHGYTELFFLDEVSAFSAGHRPCFECRRNDAKEFAACWAEAFGYDLPPKAGEMDMILHQQRLDGRMKRTYQANSEDLPDGSMIAKDGKYFAKHSGNWHLWSISGYQNAINLPKQAVQVLTPVAIIGVLKAGYVVSWHKPV